MGLSKELSEELSEGPSEGLPRLPPQLATGSSTPPLAMGSSTPPPVPISSERVALGVLEETPAASTNAEPTGLPGAEPGLTVVCVKWGRKYGPGCVSTCPQLPF